VNQINGRGAPPPVGILFAESDLAWARTGWTAATDADARTGRSLQRTATAASETVSATWLVDPNLYVEGDASDESLELDVYAFGRIGTVGTVSLALSATQDSSIIFGGPTYYTVEHGAAGKSLPVASVSARRRAWRLGTLVLPRDSVRGEGRVMLKLTGALTTVGARLDLFHLLILPARRRMGTPTGKVRDSTFPDFMEFGENVAYVKRVRDDGRGYMTRIAGGPVPRDGTPHNGIGGARMTLEPGDNVVGVFPVRGAVIDTPATSGDDAATPSVHGYSVHVTPRYRLWRPE
jgi:hypothetical protein